MKISEKSRGKGRLSAMLARAKQLGSGFSPGLFRLFSPDAKHPAWRPFPTIRHCRARTSDKRRSLRSVPHWAFSRLFPPPAEAGYGPAVPESDMSAETFDVRPLRNSGNQAFSPHHVNSANAGPGDHPLVGVWGGQPQRNPSSANSNLHLAARRFSFVFFWTFPFFFAILMPGSVRGACKLLGGFRGFF